MTSTSAPGFELRNEPTPLRVLGVSIWRSRDLLVMLARKQFFAQYRRASFGLLWAVGLPLVQGAVLAVVFTRVVRIHTGVSYPVFVFAGILPWSFLSSTLSMATTSIVDGQDLATKVYFPRSLLPLSTIGAVLYAFPASIVVLLGMSIGFGAGVGMRTLLLVPAILLMVTFTTSLSLVLSALYVYFRDTKYLVQAALLVWFYASPVIYPIRLAPGALRRIVQINPASGMIELFRAATVGAPGWPVTVWWSLGWVVALLLAAGWLHRRFDRVFIDLL